MTIEDQPVIELVYNLCKTLETEGIIYCHWKSNNMLDRSANGANDLDLLVSRADVQLFTEILYKLGFRQAQEIPERKMPGVLDYFGYDQSADRFIHVHAHYQLIIGQDATKNYHLPIENPYLESASQGPLFKVPSPEFELLVFVIRMVLKHSTWDMMLSRLGKLSDTETQEFAYLENLVSQNKVYAILKQYLPYVNTELFDSCRHTLQPNCPFWYRARVGIKLQKCLKANARRSQISDLLLKFWRRFVEGFQRRGFGQIPRKQFSCGGSMVALVGGDGSGKTTAVEELHAWLSGEFETLKVHMGKPPWSWTTITVRGMLKIGTKLGFYPFLRAPIQYTHDPKLIEFPGYPWLIREVCTARDRYLIYKKSRRFASNGGLVFCDRFPLPQIKLMDGPQIERMTITYKKNWLISFLMELESHFYQSITMPDLLIVLRTDPEIAVDRKVEECAESVLARSKEIWEIDWRQTPAHVIDAGNSKDEVQSELKAIVWSLL